MASDPPDPCRPEQFSDPDVAGFGVLISFGVSILVMITAIIYGYLTRSLRPDRYNGLDDFILDALRSPRGRDEDYIRRRVAALEKFILSLGDQQLVTGISLIIAIYLIRFGVAGLDQKVSVYSYCVAVHLALLSCVVHLSCLTILRDHFDSHRHLRSFRICLILPAIGLLLPQLVFAQAFDPKVTLMCALDSTYYEPFHQNGFISWDGFYQSRSIYLQTLVILVIVPGDYIRRVLEVYFPLYRKAPDLWSAKVCSKYIGYPKQRDLEFFMDQSCKDRIERAARLVFFRRGGIRHTPVLLIAGVVMRELSHSFLTEIAWLLFYTTYSLCQLASFFTWAGNGTVKQPTITFTPSFGQILPLVLLMATGLAITEAFAEVEKEKHNSGRALTDQLEGWSNRGMETTGLGALLGGLVSPQEHELGLRSLYSPEMLHLRPSTVVRHLCLFSVQYRNHIATNLDEFRICLELYAPHTFIWIMVASKIIILLFAAVVIAGLMSSATLYSEALDWAGLFWSMIFFNLFTFGFLTSILDNFYWIWMRCFRSPLDLC